MALALVFYLINGLLYTITTYCVLLMLEKAGKRDRGSRAQRVDLAARWAVGFTLLQICSDTIGYIL
jgi:hypothetical protein